MKQKIMILGMLIALAFLVGCVNEEVKEAPSNGDINIGIANPASVFCVEKGGTLEIVDSPEGQYGICMFEDGTQCEEWAFFRGECGPKVKVYCTEEQKRADVCTMDYNPVCGNDGITYGNACGGCSRGIDYYTPGEC